MLFGEIMSKGGPVMWPLLACSVISLTIIIERMFFWLRYFWDRDDALIDKVLSLTEQGEHHRAFAESSCSTDPAVRMLEAGLAHRQYCLAEALEARASSEIEKMKRGMAVLDTIITMAPLLGILGTVTGIIKSFNLLGEVGIEDPRAATAGLAEALITTAAGLIVALITLLPFNYFGSKIQSAAKRLEQVGSELEVAYAKSRNNFGGKPQDASDEQL